MFCSVILTVAHSNKTSALNSWTPVLYLYIYADINPSCLHKCIYTHSLRTQTLSTSMLKILKHLHTHTRTRTHAHTQYFQQKEMFLTFFVLCFFFYQQGPCALCTAQPYVYIRMHALRAWLLSHMFFVFIWTCLCVIVLLLHTEYQNLKQSKDIFWGVSTVLAGPHNFKGLFKVGV